MSRVDKAQDWPTHAQLYPVAVKKLCRLGDALIVEQRAVEAAEIVEHELAVAAAKLRVAA